MSANDDIVCLPGDEETVLDLLGAPDESTIDERQEEEVLAAPAAPEVESLSDLLREAENVLSNIPDEHEAAAVAVAAEAPGGSEIRPEEVSEATKMTDEENEFYVIKDGMITLKKAIRFDKDSAVLQRNVNDGLLAALVRLFNRYPNTSILLVGFTAGRAKDGQDVDAKLRVIYSSSGRKMRGTFQELSEWRSNVVGKELSARGVRQGRVMTLGLGTDGLGKRTEVYVGSQEQMVSFRRKVRSEHVQVQARPGGRRASVILGAVRQRADSDQVYATMAPVEDDFGPAS